MTIHIGPAGPSPGFSVGAWLQRLGAFRPASSAWPGGTILLPLPPHLPPGIVMALHHAVGQVRADRLDPALPVQDHLLRAGGEAAKALIEAWAALCAPPLAAPGMPNRDQARRLVAGHAALLLEVLALLCDGPPAGPGQPGAGGGALPATAPDGYGITWSDAERTVLRIDRIAGPATLGPTLIAAAANIPAGAVYLDFTDGEDINEDLGILGGAEAVAAGRWPLADPDNPSLPERSHA